MAGSIVLSESTRLSEILEATTLGFNPQVSQREAYVDYLKTGIKTTRNDPNRSATARYNLVNKAEVNALALLPQFLAEEGDRIALSTSDLSYLGSKNIFSTNVTNKLDYFNNEPESAWCDRLIANRMAHEKLWEGLIQQLIRLEQNPLPRHQHLQAVDAVLYQILFIIRFHGVSFREVYREGVLSIFKNCPTMNSYLKYNLESFGAFVHYEDLILKTMSQDHYQSHRNFQYLVYASPKLKAQFLKVPPGQQDGLEAQLCQSSVYFRSLFELGQFALKCLRFKTYYTEPLSLIALSWLNYVVEGVSIIETPATRSLCSKIKNMLRIEQNRLAQWPSTKKATQLLLNKLQKLNVFQ